MTGQERPQADTSALLTAAQVATRLGISLRTVRRYGEEGRLPRVHVGRAVRYASADVEALISADAGHGQDGPPSGQERPGHERPPARPPAATDALAVATRALDVLQEELLALRAENAARAAENAALHREVTEKAEAAGLWQGRARTLEAQLLQLTAGQESPQMPVEPAPAAPGDAEGPETTPTSLSRWRRFWRALRGE
jgi:excisionase family DNA binding protein